MERGRAARLFSYFSARPHISYVYKTEKEHLTFWSARQMDWKSCYLDTWEHPHRQMIVDALRMCEFDSLLEVGCASGPNLFRIHREFPNVALSGVDVNAQAIGVARHFLTGDFRVGTLAGAGFPDQSADVVLTDMVLIYVERIEEMLAEFRRLARKRIILCELHSARALERAALKLAAGYRVCDYPALLERNGWRDIKLLKIPRELWPEGRPQKRFGFLVTASV